MNFSKIINRVLALFGLRITRVSKFNYLIGNLEESETKKSRKMPIIGEDSEIDFKLFLHNLELTKRDLLRHQIYTKWALIDLGSRIIPVELSERICPLCGHNDLDRNFLLFRSHCIFGGGNLLRFQCPVCDVIFGPDKMFILSDVELTEDYEWHYKAYEEGDSTDKELRAFYSLNPFKSGVYLNYGSGAWSKTLQILRNEGWNVYAYEPHSSASTKSEFVISSQSDLLEKKFDGIFSNNVIEHFRNPIKEFRLMTDILKPRGRMSHVTPCFEYLYEFTRFHLFFFLGRSRLLLAKQCGLDFDAYIVDGEFMNLMLTKKPLEQKLWEKIEH